ncbi:transporter, major facilitator family protein [Pelomyxa schiedti]|nr:transporter, major facilitator family protein [Pelomyxa schiedti]
MPGSETEGDRPRSRCSCTIGGLGRALLNWWMPPDVPMGRLSCLLWLAFCEGYFISSVQVYIGFLVQDYVTQDPNKVGFYTGFPTMVTNVAQVLSVFIAGYLSDKWGRRPVMLIGACGSFVTAIVMCFTCNFLYIVICRGFNGFVCPQMGVMKAYLGDITGKDSRVRAYSRFCLVNAFGGILGSLLAGYTVRPAILYPNIVGEDHFLANYPYFLPNFFLVVAYLGAISFSLKYLTDMPKQPAKIEMVPLSSPEPANSDSEDHLPEKDPAEIVPESIIIDHIRSAEELTAESREFLSGSTPTSEGIRVQKEWTRKDWIVPFVLCLIYGVIGLTVTCFRSVVPIWQMSDISAGGLGFDSTQVGIFSSIFAAIVIPVQLIFYNPVVSKLRLLWTFRIGCILLIPGMLLQPTVNRVADMTILAWVLLVVLSIFQQYGMQLTFTPIITLITNSVGAG